MRRHFLIIHNPLAGHKSASLLKKTVDVLREAGCKLDVQVASDIETDRRLAADAAATGVVDAVVAAGGDSTVRGVAKGLVGTNMPLGVIPVGTGNVLAEEIGLQRCAEAIVAALTGGDTLDVRLGLANDEPFLLMAGIGFDAEVVRRLDHGVKQHIRKAAYLWPGLRTLFCHRPPALSVELDGKRETASFVVVSRVRHYGGSFLLAPDADMCRPDFQVALFSAGNRMQLAMQLVWLAAGRLKRLRSVKLKMASEMRVEAEPSALTQIDGEWFGTTPLSITLSPSTVRLIVPARAKSAGRSADRIAVPADGQDIDIRS